MRPSGLAIRNLTPLAAGGVLLALANVQSSAAGAQTAFLAVVIGGVLASLAMLARPGAATLTTTAVLAVAVAALMGQGPHRSAAVFFLLTAILIHTAIRTAWRDLTHDAPADFAKLAAFALGLQLLLRSDLSLSSLLIPRILVSLLVLPLVAAAALFALSRVLGAREALLTGMTVATVAPGWNVTSTLTLTALAAALAAGGLIATRIVPLTKRPPWRDSLLDVLLAWSAGLLFAVTLLAAPPWRRPQPLVALLDLFRLQARTAIFLLLVGIAISVLVRARFGARRAGGAMAMVVVLLGWRAVPTTTAVPISWQRVVLSTSEPLWRARLDAAEGSEIVLDSHLLGGEALVDGTWVAVLRVKVDGTMVRRRVLVGEHTADTTDTDGSPPIRLSQIAADGTLARRYRGRFPLDASGPVEFVALRVNPDLPPDVRWILDRLELRR